MQCTGHLKADGNIQERDANLGYYAQPHAGKGFIRALAF